MMLPGLKKYRILAGLTQGELAERVGMHRDSIIKSEQGKRPARPRTLKNLADTLDVDTRDLWKTVAEIRVLPPPGSMVAGRRMGRGGA